MREEIREIEIRKISPNLRMVCTAECIREIENAISRHEQLEPIHIYFAHDSFRILDGEKRWRACKRLGINIINAIIAKF
jgi:ParB family chromosome partitioning protein